MNFVRLLKYVVSFFFVLCFQRTRKMLHLTSHLVFYFFKLRAMFSRSFCLTMCTSNPFLLISAPYSNCWVNSHLLYQISISFYSFWSFRKFFGCYMPGTVTCVENKALLNLFYLFFI